MCVGLMCFHGAENEVKPSHMEQMERFSKAQFPESGLWILEKDGKNSSG